MSHRLGAVIVAIAAAMSAGPAAFAQVRAAPHPTLAGTWVPSDPEQGDRLFAVGLSAIPGRGRLTLEQRPDRLTVTIAVPDDMLDPLLAINGRFYTTIVYRISQNRVRPGGEGAGGPRPLLEPTWLGDRLVIPDARPAARPVTMAYSLDGERLKVETSFDVRAAHTNTVAQWFVREK